MSIVKRLRSMMDTWTLPLFPEIEAARAPAPTPKLFGARRRKGDSLLVKRQRRSTKWRGVPAKARKAPSSVFDLGSRAVVVSSLMGGANLKAGKYAARVQPTKGVVRIEGAAYPARWTQEDYDRERTRRANQKPPKPSDKIKTKSDKLKQLVGSEG